MRWNENTQTWMAWVRMPDGSRRKVKRVEKRDAEADLQELLARRAAGGDAPAKRQKNATFADVIDNWLKDGCPTSASGTRTRHAKTKSPNTIDNARSLLDSHVRVSIGMLWVDRTTTERIEMLFAGMAAKKYATSTIDRTWGYLNQACQYALRHRQIKANPVQEVLLPEARPPKPRKSLTLEQANRIIFEAIPNDSHPAMWLTGLMCGLRPGELAGLRWAFVNVDGDEPSIEIAERASEIRHKYAGQSLPKTDRSRRTIGLHPLLVAALVRHREDMTLLGQYDPNGFVFCTRNGTPFSLANLRRYFKRLCERAELGQDWTTYELRHSFVSIIADQLDDLVKVADLAGHVNTRTTQGYRHPIRPSLPHAIDAWDQLLGRRDMLVS